MKPLLPVATAIAALAFAGAAMAAAPVDDAPTAENAHSANEQAGLPDLKAINRPGAAVSSKVEINVPRTPSFYERSPNGTEITEYRDKGKPVEIHVHSNLGTSYQMSPPIDASPTVQDTTHSSQRLPSVKLSY